MSLDRHSEPVRKALVELPVHTIPAPRWRARYPWGNIAMRAPLLHTGHSTLLVATEWVLCCSVIGTAPTLQPWQVYDVVHRLPDDTSLGGHTWDPGWVTGLDFGALVYQMRAGHKGLHVD